MSEFYGKIYAIIIDSLDNMLATNNIDVKHIS